MLDPAGLFELAEQLPDLDRPVLVQAMDGFVDAGNAGRLARAHLLETLDSEVVATFDVDQLFDYRGRRPEMLFVTDHWESFAAPQLVIHAVRDAAGQPFLLLPARSRTSSGSGSSLLSADRAPARSPAADRAERHPDGRAAHPAARPSIAHGTRRAGADYSNWLGTVQVPAAAGHLIEFRLGEGGLDAMGFAVNVPHYLAHLDYPAAAVTLLECVAGRPVWSCRPPPWTRRRASPGSTWTPRSPPPSRSPRWCRRWRPSTTRSWPAAAQGLVADGGRLPTADELGAEFEQLPFPAGRFRIAGRSAGLIMDSPWPDRHRPALRQISGMTNTYAVTRVEERHVI